MRHTSLRSKDNPGRAVIKTGLGARGRKKIYSSRDGVKKKKEKKGGLEVGRALKKRGGNWG